MHAGSSLRRALGHMEKTYFAVIQVDGTKSTTALQTTKNLHKQLKDTGLSPKSFYIEELDLFQIFLFFVEPVYSKDVTALLKTWLDTNWFPVDADATSILPTGSPFQIPLQASFTWINDELGTIVSASEMSFQNALSMFMQDIRSNATDFEAFNTALSQQRVVVQTADCQDTVRTLAALDCSPENDPVAAAEANLYMSFSPDCPDSFILEALPLSDDGPAEVLRSKEYVRTELSPDSESTETPILCPDEKLNLAVEDEPEPLITAIDRTSEFVRTDETTTIEDAGSCFESSIADSPLQPEPLDEPDFSEFSGMIFKLKDSDIVQSDQPPTLSVVCRNIEDVAQMEISERRSPVQQLQPIQSLFFEENESNEGAPTLPGADCDAHAFASTVDHSARDGPIKRKSKSVKPAQKAQPHWDSFEQLTLPFGMNTS